MSQAPRIELEGALHHVMTLAPAPGHISGRQRSVEVFEYLEEGGSLRGGIGAFLRANGVAAQARQKAYCGSSM